MDLLSEFPARGGKRPQYKKCDPTMLLLRSVRLLDMPYERERDTLLRFRCVMVLSDRSEYYWAAPIDATRIGNSFHLWFPPMSFASAVTIRAYKLIDSGGYCIGRRSFDAPLNVPKEATVHFHAPLEFGID